MIVVPEICATERIGRSVRFQLKIPANLPYFQGHFEQCRLLPGVVQIGWAIELGRKYLSFAGTFSALSAVKFTRVIQPDDVIMLELEYSSEKRQLDFAYDLDGRACSSGSVLFD